MHHLRNVNFSITTLEAALKCVRQLCVPFPPRVGVEATVKDADHQIVMVRLTVLSQPIGCGATFSGHGLVHAIRDSAYASQVRLVGVQEMYSDCALRDCVAHGKDDVYAYISGTNVTVECTII